MDFLTSNILSSIVYDLAKSALLHSISAWKEKLVNYIVDDKTILLLQNKFESIDDIEDKSEKALTKIIDKDPEIQKILPTIQYYFPTINITQTHNGTGDNVGRDKNTK